MKVIAIICCIMGLVLVHGLGMGLQARCRARSTVLSAIGDKKGRASNKFPEMPRDKLLEMKELETKYKGLIEDDADGLETGDALRSGRERDLKAQFASEPKLVRRIDPTTIRKWPIELIEAVMVCLNMVYAAKGADLADAERVGILDWAEFDAMADAAGLMEVVEVGQYGQGQGQDREAAGAVDASDAGAVAVAVGGYSDTERAHADPQVRAKAMAAMESWVCHSVP